MVWEEELETPKQSYAFTKEGVSIEATSLEEAEKLLTSKKND